MVIMPVHPGCTGRLPALGLGPGCRGAEAAPGPPLVAALLLLLLLLLTAVRAEAQMPPPPPPLSPVIVTVSAPALSSPGGGRRLSQLAETLRASLLSFSALSGSPRAASVDAAGDADLGGGAAYADAVEVADVSSVFACVRGFSARLSTGAVAFLRAQGSPGAIEVLITPDVILRAASLAGPQEVARTLQSANETASLVSGTYAGVAASEAFKAAASWSQDRIDQRAVPLDGLYGASQSGAGVDVYILDSGARKSHEEFSLQSVPIESANFVAAELPSRSSDDVGDCAGHGTHISGTVLGRNVGVAPGARLVVVRVYGCDASGPVSSVLRGVDYVLRRMAMRPGVPAVINLSFATPRLPLLDVAVGSLIAAGAYVAAAAGNTHSNACETSPAADGSVLTAAATDRFDSTAAFSSYGNCTALLAPGVDVVSAYFMDDVSLALMSGTSMAAPHVAGVLALILEEVLASSSAPLPAASLVRAAAICASSPLVVTDAVAAAAGTPPLLLYSSPRGLAQACWPAGLAVAPPQGSGALTLPAKPAAPSSPAVPVAGAPGGGGAAPNAGGGAVSGGYVATRPALGIVVTAGLLALFLLS